MDSLTHVLLGAAIGEATLGKQAGKKAMLWGAVAATAPDLDVFVGIFMNDVDKIIFHRGITHSIFFVLLSSPLYGWIISKIHSKDSINWKQWTFLVFLSQFTHILLDSFTSYGTQIFLPFTNEAISLSTISVLDPIFTMPLLIGFLFLLRSANASQNRQLIAFVSILISCLYLMFTVFNKIHVDQQFRNALNETGAEISKLDIKPTLLNNLLWRGIALVEDTDFYLVGYYSVADGTSDIEFELIRGNHDLLQPYNDLQSVRRLKWVSKGFYQVEKTTYGYLFNDLRFGRVAEFSGNDTPYAFSYYMEFEPGEGDFRVNRIELQIDRQRESSSVSLLWDKILGNDSVAE